MLLARYMLHMLLINMLHKSFNQMDLYVSHCVSDNNSPNLAGITKHCTLQNIVYYSKINSADHLKTATTSGFYFL